MDYYKILNVSRSATLSEIKIAYRTLALKFHPDRNSTNKQAAANKFNTVSIAYKTLGDINLRHDYDDLIGNRHSTWQQPSQSARANNHSARSSQKVRPTARSGASVGKAGITREQFDVPLWNVWHYGDDPEKFTDFERTDSRRGKDKHNSGNEAYTSNVNWDHFHTRNRPETTTRNTIIDDDVLHYQSDHILTAEEKADIVEKLHAKREERRKNDPRFNNVSSGIGGSTKGKDKVVFNTSPPTNEGENGDKKKEESSGCTIS
jgi:curved DNA-binding protein CbpA